jgi:hypothetical protein
MCNIPQSDFKVGMVAGMLSSAFQELADFANMKGGESILL